MKRQIRRCVFETNSSSMHSLVVMKKSEKYTPKEILEDIYLCTNADGERGVWDIDSDQLYFGRHPFRALGTFKDKWLYTYASLVGEYNDEVCRELKSIAFKYIPGLKKINMPTSFYEIPDVDDDLNKEDDYAKEYGKTKDWLMAYIKEKEKDYGFKIDYHKDQYGNWCIKIPDNGYVDEDILSGFLRKENISIEEFILNKKYVVIQDGDEYCYWKEIKNTGLINMYMIDHEYSEVEW